jgi:serine/threonine protein kinase
MGIVYRAQHETTGEAAALKTARNPYASQMSGLRCEIHALTRIRHPGVVRILDEGQEQGLPWYAMELLDGRTLEGWLHELWTSVPSGVHVTIGRAETLLHEAPGSAKGTPMVPLSAPPPAHTPSPVAFPLSGPIAAPIMPSPELSPRRAAAAGQLTDVLRVFMRLCAPLQFLHASGIVHRDLKPGNVFLRPGGVPVLVDFGLVVRAEAGPGRERIEVAGDVLGTAAYMSPEQVRGQLPDPRSDLYALGCMLYEAVTGRVPFAATNLSEVMWMHLQRMPTPPSQLAEGVPPELDELCARLLAKDPLSRLGHADDVAAVLADVIGERGAAATDRRGGYLYRPRMAGRDELLERLRFRIEGVRRGHGGVVLLGGESGVGKTTVASAAAHHARVKRLVVVTGECQPVSGHDVGAAAAAPLNAFRGLFELCADRCREQGVELTDRWLGARGPMLAPYAAELRDLPGQERYPAPPEVPAQAAKTRLVEAARDLVAAMAGERGLMLVLDDLQWADELSLGVLGAMDDGWCVGKRVLVLGTYRSEEAQGLGELRRTPGLEDIAVGRLDQANVGAIVADMLALPSAPPELERLLAVRSDGNPFFVAEYLRTAVAEGLLYRLAGAWQVDGEGQGRFERLGLPASLRALVARRLDGLGAAARRLVDAAAVLGREVDADVAVAVAELGSDDALAGLKELTARQVLLEVRDGRYRFLHDKLREIAYDGIDERRRQALHRRAALTLEARHLAGEGEIIYQELAHHFSAAGELEPAMHYLELAGEQARKTFANREAARVYGELLDLEARLPTRAEPVVQARWHRLRADALLGLGKSEASQDHLLRAVRLLGVPMPDGRFGLIAGLVGRGLEQLGHRLRMPAPAEGAAARARIVEAARAYEMLMPVSYYVTGDIRRILYATLANVNLAEAVGPSPELAMAYGNMHVTTGLIPMPGLAEAYWKRTREVLERVADPAVRSWVCILAGAYAVGVGDWSRAQALGDEALAVARGVGFHRRAEEALGVLGNVHVLRGEFVDALNVSQAARQSGQRGDAQTQLWGHVGEAQALVQLGRFADARAAAERAAPLIDEVQGRPERIMALGALARTRFATGDRAAALLAARAGLEAMERGTPVSFYCIVAYSSVAETLLEIVGPGREAQRGVREVRRSAKVFPVHRPRALLLEARVAELRGKPRLARRCAALAAEEAVERDMPSDAAMARAVLLRLGAD